MRAKTRRWLPPDLAADPAGRGGYWLYLGHLATVFGIALSNALFGGMLLWAIRRRHKIAWGWRRLGPLATPLALYVVLFLTSVAASTSPAISAGELQEMLSLLTLALAPFLVIGERDTRQVYDALIAMTAVVAVFGLVQQLAGGYGSLQHRIPGPFSHYMTYAGVLLVGCFLILARLFSGEHRRPIYWLLLGLVGLTLLLTLTRGSWVALVLTVTAYLLVRARRYLPLYLLAAVAFLALAPDSWIARVRSIGDLRDPSNYDRLCMADAGFYMISERPLFGIGPGMVRHRYPIYRQATAPRFEVTHLHNTFLQLAAERGLLSLTAYLWLMLSAARLAYRAYRQDGGAHGPRADLYLGALMVIVGFNVAGLFEDNWRDTEVQRLVLFLLTVPLCLRAEAADDPAGSPEHA